MTISQDNLVELQHLYKKEYGVLLSLDECHEFGSLLVGLLQSVYEPKNY